MSDEKPKPQTFEISFSTDDIIPDKNPFDIVPKWIVPVIPGSKTVKIGFKGYSLTGVYWVKDNDESPS